MYSASLILTNHPLVASAADTFEKAGIAVKSIYIPRLPGETLGPLGQTYIDRPSEFAKGLADIERTYLEDRVAPPKLSLQTGSYSVNERRKG